MAVSCDKKNEQEQQVGNWLTLNYGDPAVDGFKTIELYI